MNYELLKQQRNITLVKLFHDDKKRPETTIFFSHEGKNIFPRG